MLLRDKEIQKHNLLYQVGNSSDNQPPRHLKHNIYPLLTTVIKPYGYSGIIGDILKCIIMIEAIAIAVCIVQY